MKAKTVLGVALGLWLVFLLALPSSAGEVSSVPKVNATLNCSPIKVTAVNTDGGIHFIANGTCEGYIINPHQTKPVAEPECLSPWSLERYRPVPS